MRTIPEDKYDKKELEKLNAEQWQIDLLNLNPSYVFWGPHEDYMWKKNDRGWDSPAIKDTWEDFGPWGLDELNELVNFYFSVNRKSRKCESCGETGYAPKAKEIADAWYDFENRGTRWCDKITQDEVQALVDANRLHDFTHEFIKDKGWQRKKDGYVPTADEVNAWESGKGFGHDAINRGICIRTRCERLGIELLCPECHGDGYIYTADKAHVSLTLWMIHPRKGCSRGVEVTNVEQNDLPVIFEYLQEAAKRNADRFSKITSN